MRGGAEPYLDAVNGSPQIRIAILHDRSVTKGHLRQSPPRTASLLNMAERP
jgi:hypothetical protein